MNHDPKRFSTLQARAALSGVVLQAIRSDLEQWTFIATIGAITTELPTLDAVEQWLGKLATLASTMEGQSA